MACIRCKRVCINYGISKLVYLACATLVTGGFIIECILIHLVVMPYVSESNFKEASCKYNHSEKPVLTQCENKCSKARGVFPCMPLKVFYNTSDKKFSAHGYLYDYYRTYNLFGKKKCSTSPCHGRKEDNERWVANFNHSLLSEPKFRCFYNSKNIHEVLLNKLHPLNITLHCIIWPLAIFVVGIIAMWITYCITGCKVWTQDKTVIA